MRIRYLSNRVVPLAVVSWHPSMLYAFIIVDKVFRRYTGKDAIMTAAQEDAHGARSLHYGTEEDHRCRAADFSDDRVKGTERFDIERELRERLGSEFDVVWEEHHIHIEWDPNP